MKKQINVVGAAFVENGKILATKRNDDRVLGTLWEFPGGKIEPHETPEQALQRELTEEFNDEIIVGPRVTETSSHEYDFGVVNLTVYYAKFLTHHFDLVAHSKVEWLNQDELGQLSWAEADQKAVKIVSKADLTQVKFNESN
ncbi:(deoxy)nucleoside triphosphate pyrophosphohydrolase [Secundilactobacillus silagei]|uniref:8-oxo-dGTP diphosphatase n=1 Tax=Secundilactobacillus silagei JCM 19001 TaxID=1302250 RepID=A0A1Z5IG35_9LACO|nr:(deoxy)nucleoside triphosphate pyrophosphohydrolase [Secundilactobacillus silagei]TDG73393.1 hypothetical protein C5L25_000542 [Secundilactobacillus silagei JCM 19001]GAX00764.1 7,8-dihydro-8-oxoguanine-triphosphatase MutT [Secundilactobacillus silagei JCM 19001]